MKTKRTAGERRFRELKRRSDQARYKLEQLQSSMQNSDSGNKQLRQMYVMQIITETIEKLRDQ